jgi:hypothetical protein
MPKIALNYSNNAQQWKQQYESVTEWEIQITPAIG